MLVVLSSLLSLISLSFLLNSSLLDVWTTDLITTLTAVHAGDIINPPQLSLCGLVLVCLRRYKMPFCVNLFQTIIMSCLNNKLFSLEDINTVATNQTFDNSSGRQHNLDVSISGS